MFNDVFTRRKCFYKQLQLLALLCRWFRADSKTDCRWKVGRGYTTISARTRQTPENNLSRGRRTVAIIAKSFACGSHLILGGLCLCDILYKRLRNTLTYLLAYL